MDFSSLDLNALVNDYAIPWGIRIALALVIFYLGRGVVALVVRGVEKVLERQKVDETLVSFMTSILRWLLLLFCLRCLAARNPLLPPLPPLPSLPPPPLYS